jgi:hypothetical protein
MGEGTRFILLFEKNKIVEGRRNFKINQHTVSRDKMFVPVAFMA